MNKKIVIISSSFHHFSNSLTLCEQFLKGAKESGHQCEIIKLDDVKFCIGCLKCQDTHKCVLNDQMNDLYEVISKADVLVFATPIYFYSVSGQLKTVLDRLNPLYGLENNFKEVYLLATAADTEDEAFDGAIKCIEGWLDCFPNVKFCKTVKGKGLVEANDVINSEAYLEAYNVGKNV